MSSTNNDTAAAEKTNNIRNVRQRANPLGLESLPDDTLLRVATFLSHTTRALLSVALTAPSTSYDLGGHNEREKDVMAKKVAETIRECGWQSAALDSLSDVLSYAIENCKITKINNNPQHQPLSKASKIVLSNPYYRECFRYGTRISYMRNDKYEEDWKVLDLLDLDKSLQMRLTDGDIAGMLVCIDAVNNLEEIKLPHCINVRGDGLAPLRGSIVLKRADLSIVSEVGSMTPKLSINSVLPVLDSIIAMSQNSMSRLHTPREWSDTYSERLNNFYLENHLLPQVCRYRRMSQSEKSEKRAQYLLDNPDRWNHMSKRKMDCKECFSDFQNHSGRRVTEMIYITCEGGKLEVCPEPGCGRKYCSPEPGCGIKYCIDHANFQIKKCNVCEKRKCYDCSDVFFCEVCDRQLCGECVESIECCACGHHFNCAECAANGDGDAKQCRQCRDCFCSDCDPDLTHLGDVLCEACRGVDPALWHGVNH